MLDKKPLIIFLSIIIGVIISITILSLNISTDSTNIPENKTSKMYNETEVKSIIKTFENKYKTAKTIHDGLKTTLRAENPHGAAISLTIQPLSDGNTSIIISCNHNDWRGQEVITENILDYLTNENCFNPSLEELQDTST